MPEGTDFLYPFIEGDERDAGRAAGRPRPLGGGEGRGERAVASAHADAVRGRPRRRGHGDGRRVRRPAGGCSRSATAAARPTRPSLAALFARPPSGRALPARCLVDDTAVAHRARQRRRLRPGVLPAADRPRSPGRRRGRLLDQRQLRATCSSAFAEARRRGMRHRRPGRLRRRRDGAAPDVQHCLVVRSDSVHRIQETQAALGFALWDRGAAPAALGGRRWLDAGEREAAVLDRIEAFRRRRPRLNDEVVTLAHGAGGKASAALVDAVFLDAFAAGEPGPLADAATLTLPTGERIAFTTDSFVVQPLRFPGGSIGHLAVHGTVNDLAVQGAEPAWLSAAFVIEEGFPVAELRADRRRHGRGRRGRRRRASSPATRRWSAGAPPTALYITTAGVGVVPAGRYARSRARAAGRRRARLGHDRRPRHGGDAGPRRPGARGRHPVRHRAARPARRGPPRRRARHPLAARPDPRRRRHGVQRAGPATPTSPSCSTRPCCRSTRR